MGRTRVLYDTAHILAAAGHQIVLVGTCRAEPEYGCPEEEFKKMAEKYKADFFNDPDINRPEMVNRLKKAGADLGISVNWLRVIGGGAIEAFPMGILNCHSGDLPRYRGNACPNWAILNGEKHMGLCVHFMAPGQLDSGHILVRRIRPISERTTLGELVAWTQEQAPEMFAEAVAGLEGGRITPRPQPTDPELSLRCHPRRPEDGLIDWNISAIEIDRLIRASSQPLAGAYTFYQGKKLIIWKSSIYYQPAPYLAVAGQVIDIDTASGRVLVASGNGAVALETVQFEGAGEAVPPCRIISSTRDRLGLNVEMEIIDLRKIMEEIKAELKRV